MWTETRSRPLTVHYPPISAPLLIGFDRKALPVKRCLEAAGRLDFERLSIRSRVRRLSVATRITKATLFRENISIIRQDCERARSRNALLRNTLHSFVLKRKLGHLKRYKALALGEKTE